MAMRLYITRHGRTDNNKEGYPFHSKEDSTLNEEGSRQAQRLSEHLKDEPIDAIYASPMKRTLRTAEIIQTYHDANITTDSRLREVDFGILDGKSLSYVKEHYGEIYEERKRDKFNYVIPEGESYRQAHERLNEVLDEMRQEEVSNILIITHATALKLLLMALRGMTLKEVDNEYYAPTCLFVFDEHEQAITWNSTTHLHHESDR